MSITATQEQGAQDRQFVVFEVNGEEYGLPIEHVQEVVKMPEITPLPNSEAYIEGLMNLRGQVVPVLSLLKRFGLEVGTGKQQHVIVLDAEPAQFGVLTDTVQEVLHINSEQVQEAPAAIQASVGAEYIEGVIVLQEANHEEQEEDLSTSSRTILILNLRALLTQKDQEHLTQV